jgi:nucleoside-diphosphate-sugar epimerase
MSDGPVKVLLTGGCGLVGRTLTPLLRDACEVTHFDVADPGDGLACVVGDMRDGAALEAACRGKDAVIHVAALHGRRWTEAGDEASFETNVIGTRNVLAAAAQNGVRRVVFTSSIWATGHGADVPYLPIDEQLPREPVELYGLTKKLGEAMCRYYTGNCNMSTICLRPGGILPADAPPGGRVGLLSAAVDVRDVAQSHVLALNAPESIRHEVFVITADSPLARVEPEQFFADPVGCLETKMPGVAQLVAEGKVEIPTFREWYTIEKAQRMLGYMPEHNFNIGLYD